MLDGNRVMVKQPGSITTAPQPEAQQETPQQDAAPAAPNGPQYPTR
jgi:hypothetical protein